MTVFAAALGLIYRDRNMSVAAEYLPGGAGPATPVRVMRPAPDAMGEFNGGRFVDDTIRIHVQTADVPELEEGDRFVIDGETVEVIGDPMRDRDRLEWRAVVRAV